MLLKVRKGDGKWEGRNGERETEKDERRTMNGEQGTGNLKPGTGVWERVDSGNPHEKSKWLTKPSKQSEFNCLLSLDYSLSFQYFL